MAALSPDLPRWVVSPFKWPFPEQPVPAAPGCGAPRLSPLEPFSTLTSRHPSISILHSPVPELSRCCPELLSTLPSQSWDVCSWLSMGPLQIWPAGLEGACKNFLALREMGNLSAGEDVGGAGPSDAVGRNVNGAGAVEDNVAAPQKVKHRATARASSPTPRRVPKEWRTGVETNPCTLTFMAA